MRKTLPVFGRFSLRSGARFLVRGLSLALFLWLLLPLSWPLAEGALPPDLYLRLDPLVAAFIPVTAREWLPRLWPGVAVIVSAALFGRLFCGWLCPMGVTLDLARFAGRHAAGVKARLTARSESHAEACHESHPESHGDFHSRARSRPGTPERAGRFTVPSGLRRTKYLILALMAGAAFAGANFAFWGSPIALVTRFWGLLVHPVLLLWQDAALNAGRPLFDAAGLDGLAYVTVKLRRFDSLYFVLGFFFCLFLLERVRPRFWCRYLCPAGALLGLFARVAPWRRRARGCVACGFCEKGCPQGAIAPGGAVCEHGECIACQGCVDACPSGGVRFGIAGGDETVRHYAGGESAAVDIGRENGASVPENGLENDRSDSADAGQRTSQLSRRAYAQGHGGISGAHETVSLPSRRAFVGAAAAGTVLASVQYSGAASLLRLPARGSLWSPGLIRPPASLPEPVFLDRCVRCGACMKVCPTNGLQPAWFAAGTEGMFSPLLVPRIGPCEPECNACGAVCPTGAIRPVPLAEKKQAKIGTAVVNPRRCLAWAEGRRCMVCQEVCPYGAVKIVSVPGARVPAPVMRPERCFGCGFCEEHCPTRLPSIVVEPLNALRLETGGFAEAAREAGLSLSTEQGAPYPEEGAGGDYEGNGEYPDDGSGGLPPGFSE